MEAVAKLDNTRFLGDGPIVRLRIEEGADDKGDGRGDRLVHGDSRVLMERSPVMRREVETNESRRLPPRGDLHKEPQGALYEKVPVIVRTKDGYVVTWEEVPYGTRDLVRHAHNPALEDPRVLEGRQALDARDLPPGSRS